MFRRCGLFTLRHIAKCYDHFAVARIFLFITSITYISALVKAKRAKGVYKRIVSRKKVDKVKRGVLVLVKSGFACRSVNGENAGVVLFQGKRVERSHKNSHDRDNRVNGTIETFRASGKTGNIFAQV